MAGMVIQLFYALIAFSGAILILFLVLSCLLKIARDEFSRARPIPAEDPFFLEHGYSWSYVFVYEVLTEEKERSLNGYQRNFTMKKIIEAILLSGFEVRCFYSAQRDEVYVKVRASPDLLKKEAVYIFEFSLVILIFNHSPSPPVSAKNRLFIAFRCSPSTSAM